MSAFVVHFQAFLRIYTGALATGRTNNRCVGSFPPLPGFSCDVHTCGEKIRPGEYRTAARADRTYDASHPRTRERPRCGLLYHLEGKAPSPQRRGHDLAGLVQCGCPYVYAPLATGGSRPVCGRGRCDQLLRCVTRSSLPAKTLRYRIY